MNLSSAPRPAATDHAQIVLNTIRQPVIMVGPDNLIAYANADAEDFFRTSAAVLARNTLARFVPFGSPPLTLVEQVRERRAHARAGRELGDQHRGLPDDRVDDELDVHAALQAKVADAASRRVA